MMELQATEAIVNNVLGTLNVARAAGAYGTSKFINVSTDKAVNPVNVMGATKRLAEMVVEASPRVPGDRLRLGPLRERAGQPRLRGARPSASR